MVVCLLEVRDASSNFLDRSVGAGTSTVTGEKMNTNESLGVEGCTENVLLAYLSHI